MVQLEAGTLTDQKVISVRIEWGHLLGGLTVPAGSPP